MEEVRTCMLQNFQRLNSESECSLIAWNCVPHVLNIWKGELDVLGQMADGLT